jgi:hypothetical protein
MLSDFAHFLRAVFHNWKNGMAGGFCLLFTFAGVFMPWVTGAVLFALLGIVCLLFACFMAWRQERQQRMSQVEYLRLLRIADEGERVVAATNTDHGDTSRLLASAVELKRWHDGTLATLKKDYSSHWHHFVDVGELDPS